MEDKKIDQARRLIGLNQDSRQYFYDKADEGWLHWLWKNGFFDVLKEKAEDPRRYSYKTPELQYLRRMVEHNAQMVVDILLDTPISYENFNPEVID